MHVPVLKPDLQCQTPASETWNWDCLLKLCWYDADLSRQHWSLLLGHAATGSADMLRTCSTRIIQEGATVQTEEWAERKDKGAAPSHVHSQRPLLLPIQSGAWGQGKHPGSRSVAALEITLPLRPITPALQQGPEKVKSPSSCV